MNYVLLAVLMLGMGSALTSCKDDDLTEEEKQQKQEQEDDEQYLLTSDFWKVVGQLSTAELLPDDWQNTTFEPGIGQASEKSTTTRIVLTNVAEAAAESFEELTGADVTNLDVYEWKRDFGTLTYERLHDGTGWAVVEVDIKQMPGLKRIVYCTPEQQGLNASVPGTPYYRFGDVIKKKNADGEWEYWVCVRPCFGEESKGDMHWMCLGSLPGSYIDTFKYQDVGQWWWHTSLTTKDEHIKNLTEMTYAILNPETWQQYYVDNMNESLFHDFSTRNIKYHNKYFWQMVQNAWNEKPEGENETVFELLFHRRMDEMKNAEGLNFFYGSAQGPKRTWPINMKLARVVYPDFRKLVKQSYNRRADEFTFDIREYSKYGHADNSTYFDNTYYIYPLRYARGDQLFGTQPGYYQPMSGSNDIVDVYVFNKRYKQDVRSDAEMKVFSQDNVDDLLGDYYGMGFYQVGDVVQDKKEGSLWFCIQAAGAGLDVNRDFVKKSNLLHYNKAWFVSLTPGHYEGTDQYRSNLVNAEQALSIGFGISTLCHQAFVANGPANRFNEVLQHIKTYAKVDLQKIMVIRDSLFDSSDPALNQPDRKHVPAYFTTFAYSDPTYVSRNVQPLLRFYYDNCQVETSSTGVKKWGTRYLQMNAWTRYAHGQQEEMLLQHLASNDKVSMYADQDEWVTLPWFVSGNQGHYEQPRSSAYASVVCSDFDWSESTVDYKRSGYVSMYNEPVVFFRIMAVHDIGKQELRSEDGRELTQIHLIDANVQQSSTRKDGLASNDIYTYTSANLREAMWNGEKKKGLFLSEIK